MTTLPLPIRVRLALWFFGIFSVATLSLLAVSLWIVHRSIVELETNELHERVRSVRRFLEVRPADEPPASQARALAVYDVMHGGKWLQVIDQDGNWIYRSKHVMAAYPSLALPRGLSQDQETFEYSSEGVRVRGMIAPISINGRMYTVQTGLTLNKTLVILGDFHRQLMILTPIFLILAASAGYFMSRRALSPVRAIAAEARRISDKNLDNRLPKLATRDELAEMSDTLNQMLDRIEAGYRSVREFTANAAHELRTPVSLICTETEVALAFPRSVEEFRDTCEHIQEESTRMGKLIDTLLALARADAGTESLQMEPLDLNGLVREIASKWAPRMPAAGIDFAVSTSHEAARVWGDRPSLKRLLNILLENAWRYTPSGGRVIVGVAGEDGRATLYVRDTGVGISPDHLPHVFNRFYRAGRPQNGEHASSGLGLALARWIADKHHTTIEVQSKPEHGSCFSLRFRCVDHFVDQAGDALEHDLRLMPRC
jgi:heavy metal sensor kinase